MRSVRHQTAYETRDETRARSRVWGVQDARSFMLSFQYWLGGSPENLESMLLMMAKTYVFAGDGSVNEATIVDPILLPDLGIWHPMAPQV